MGCFDMRVILLLAFLALAACSEYKMDIRQGNLITPDMRQNLRIGMTHAQVRVMLGTPLVEDPFHPERWDYVYSFEHRGKLVEQQRMTLYFNADSLARIDDSRMPAMPASAVPATGTQGSQP
jgi:outer membrane protein assembly factor BamE